MLKLRDDGIQAVISQNKISAIPSNEIDIFLALALSKLTRNEASIQEIIDAYNMLCAKYQNKKYGL